MIHIDKPPLHKNPIRAYPSLRLRLRPKEKGQNASRRGQSIKIRKTRLRIRRRAQAHAKPNHPSASSSRWELGGSRLGGQISARELEEPPPVVLGPSELRGRDFIHEWHGASDWLKYQTPSPLWGVVAGGGREGEGGGGPDGAAGRRLV